MTEVRKPQPTGPSLPITAAWKEDVRARMAELGLNGPQLAAAAGTSKQVIAAVLAPGSKRSAFVPAIHEALGWPPPPVGTVSGQRLESIEAKFRAAPPNIQQAVRLLLEGSEPKKS